MLQGSWERPREVVEVYAAALTHKAKALKPLKILMLRGFDSLAFTHVTQAALGRDLVRDDCTSGFLENKRKKKAGRLAAAGRGPHRF
jgi:hypothetical protein